MKTFDEVYFDNAATTKVYDSVADIMDKNLRENYYNPSSFYKPSIEVEKQLEQARRELADLISFNPDEIYFTSGATESNNTIIRGVVESSRDPFNIITSQIEHPSVMEVFKFYENKGVDTRYIPVDSYGNLDLEWLKNNIDENTKLVSIMAANNEIGTILNLKEAKQIVKEINPNTVFHTDYTQSFLKTGDKTIDLKTLKPDALSISAHKIHGPKGIGLLAFRKSVKIPSLLKGGGQERNFRSGTENVPHIVGFNQAAQSLNNNKEEKQKYLQNLKDHLIKRVTEEIEDVIVNTPENSIPSLVSISIGQVKAEVLLHMLEEENIYISSGSACSTHHRDSYVHKALKYDKNRSEGVLRISFSEFNTKEEVDYFVDILKEKVKNLRLVLGFKKR